jgi:hypothetical protein
MDRKNPHPLPERPRITEGICDHLGYDSSYETREYLDGEVEAGCEHGDICDLYNKPGCRVRTEDDGAICDDCGETKANCRCGE